MKKRRRGRAEMAAIDQINVTPLLDLTFILLIAFMITMPLMEYGTNIAPPEMNSDKLPEENFVSVTLTAQGTLMIGTDVVSTQELIPKLKQAKLDNPKVQLLLRADGRRSYKEVIEVMAELRRSGFNDVTLVTQAEGK